MSRPADTMDLFAVASGWWGPEPPAMRGPAHRVRLTPVQAGGAAVVARMVDRHGGAVLADATGLGKSHIALAVADHLGRRPWIAAPAHLRAMWTARAPDAIDVVSHARLSRAGASVDPAQVPSDALIVVDEAHRFRTPTTRRYAALVRLALRAPVLLVTATPVVSGADDLRALLGIFVPASQVPADEPGLVAAAAMRAVRRARGDVAAHADAWAGGGASAGGGVGSSPASPSVEGDEAPTLWWRDRVRLPPVRMSVSEGVIAQIEQAAEAAMPLHGEPARLYASMLLVRLASSPAAAARTVARARNYLVRLDEAARAGRQLDRRAFARAFGLDPDAQLAQTVMPFWYPSGPVADRVPAEAFEALAALEARLEVLAIPQDPRVRRIHADLDAGAVIVAFTSHVDTARALYRQLRPGVSAVLLTGAGAWLAGGRVPLGEGVAAFRRAAAQGPAVAIVTPVADEGIDLECADLVAHLDVPWTPAVIVQREGRLDRPGADRPMRVWTALPDPALDARLGLLGRVGARAAEARRMALGMSGELVPDPMAPAAPDAAPGAGAPTGPGPVEPLALGAAWWRRGDREVAAGVLAWRGATRVVVGLPAPIVLGWQGTQVVWAAAMGPNGWTVMPPDRALVALARRALVPRAAPDLPDRPATDARLWRAWQIASRAVADDAVVVRWVRAAARLAAVRVACGDTDGALVLRTQVLPTLRAPRTVGALARMAEVADVYAAARVPVGPPRAAASGERSTTWLVPASAGCAASMHARVRAYSDVDVPLPSDAVP